jgi:hypothetical protein
MARMIPAPETRISPWFNWFIILGLGPLIAFFLADLCGFDADQNTLQIILLVEISLVSAAVGVLLLVQTFGPWTDRDREAREWLRLLNPEPGSMLAELADNPATWDDRLDGYLRRMWRDMNPTCVPAVAVERSTNIVAGIRSSSPPPAAPAAASRATTEVGPRRRPPGRSPHRQA